MNILIIADDLREKALAGSYRTMEIIRRFSESGFGVKVVCAFEPENKTDLNYDVEFITVENIRHKNLFTKILVRAFSFPDYGVVWANKAFRTKEVQSIAGNVDVVFVSSPPHGIQKLGLMLAKVINKPLVADLRDDFLTNSRIRWLTPVHRYFGKRLEEDLVSKASKIVLNTNIVQDRFSSRYPKHIKKFLTLTNGYSERDFYKLKKDELCSPNIVYAGSHYDGYASSIMVKIANYVLKQKEKDDTLKIEIHTAGPGDWSIANQYDFWTHHGLLTKDLANNLVFNATSVILMMPPGESEPSGTIPLKTFGYLRSGTGIVYYGEKGATTDLLAFFDGAYSFKRTELEGFLSKSIDVALLKKDYYKTRKSMLEKYDISSIAKEMEDLLMDIVKK